MDRFIPFTRQTSKDDLASKIAFYKHKNGLILSGKLSAILPAGSPPEIPDAIGTFNNIRTLDVSQNNLHALTPRITQLQNNLLEFNASHNLLTDISEVGLLTNLQALDLSYNNLKPVHIAPLTTLVNLKEFNLSNNILSEEHYSSSESLINDIDSSLSPLKGPPSLQPRSPSPTPSSPSSSRRFSNSGSLPRSPLSSSSPQSSPRDNTNTHNSSLSSVIEHDSPTESSSSDETPSESSELSSNNNNDQEEISSPIPLIFTTNPASPDTPHSSRSRSPSPSLPSTASSTTPSTSPGPSPSHSPVPFARHTPLPLSHFVRLEALNLSGNHLRVFPDILSITTLTRLDLSSNKIVEIPTGFHTHLINLKELNLQSNLIEKLPPMMKSLKKLLVDKNPLHPAFLYVSHTGDLLHQLQNQETHNVGFPRSSSDSAIPHNTTTTTTPPRSATPPNGFLSRIFRKDYSFSGDSILCTPTKPKQIASAPTTPTDDTKAKETQQNASLLSTPSHPTHSRARSDAGIVVPSHSLSHHSNSSTPSLLPPSPISPVTPLALDGGSNRDAPDTPTKKRAFSLPQSPSRPPVTLTVTPPTTSSTPSFVVSPSSVTSPSRDLLSNSGAFGSPPTPLIFPASPPLNGPTPTEIYLDFVKKLTQTQNIKNSIDSFVARIKSRSLDPDDLQSALRDFVHNTHTTLTAHPLWRKAGASELQEAELHLQEYVLEHLYDHIFSARKEDQEKDREIALHIKRCYFITPDHLDIPILREHEDIWRRAEQQILQINSTRSVRSKMRCVVRMCRDLITSLARAHGDSLGADVLLPHLIYVILHSNPPHLHSNIVYMTRFSESEASETIYYVTQLVAALYFIEHVEASSLNMDPDEFHRRMNEPPRGVMAPSSGRSRLTHSSGGSAFVSLDVSAAMSLSKAIDTKRKDFALLGPSEIAKWISDNEALINQCVGLSREVLPALPTAQSSSLSSLSSSPSIPSLPSSSPLPFNPPPPRFEGVRLDDLRAVDIPTLLEDYHRLASLLHSHSSISFSSLPSSRNTHSLSSNSHSFSSNSLSSMTSNSTYSAPPSPLIPHSSSSSPSHSPSSLITFNSTSRDI